MKKHLTKMERSGEHAAKKQKKMGEDAIKKARKSGLL
jgi:hypothetical protein